jgi:hypothetical protein
MMMNCQVVDLKMAVPVAAVDRSGRTTGKSFVQQKLDSSLIHCLDQYSDVDQVVKG